MVKSTDNLFESLEHVNLETFLKGFTEYLVNTYPKIHGVSVLLLGLDDSTLICRGLKLPDDLKNIESSYLGFSFGKYDAGKISSEVFNTKKSIIVNKDHSSSFSGNEELSKSRLVNWNIHQVLAIPLLHDDKCFGITNIFSQAGDVHPADQIKNSIAANQGWIYDLYQSDRLFNKSQEIEYHYKENLEVIERSLRISKITTTDEFLETVMTEFLDWLEFDTVLVFYRELNNLVPKAYKVKYLETQERCDKWINYMKRHPYSMDLESGVIPGALIRKHYFYVEDIRSVLHIAMTENDRVANEILQGYSTMHIPLFCDNSLLGVLTIGGLTKIVSLTKQQINAINSMATVVSNSIMNAKAFDQLTIAKLEAENKLNEQAKLAQEQLEANNRQAVINDTNTSDMVAKVSHELRTPIHGILGITNLLLQTKMTSKQNSFLKQIRQSGTSLEHLVNDLLDKAKIESGKLDLESTLFSWSDIYTELKTNLTAAIENNNKFQSIDLLFIHSKEVPDQMNGDPKRITQIFTNFLNNALKFTEKGEVICRVNIKEITSENIVVNCSVEDTGIGMSEEQKSKLFQDFVQADSSISRKYGGTGLGLVIAKNLVDLMGGNISVKSEIDVGTRFSFELNLLPTPQNESWIECRKANNQQNTNIAWIDKSTPRIKNISEFLPTLGFNPIIYNDFNVLNGLLYDPQISKIILDMHLLTEQDGWKEWLDEKIYDFLFLEKVILMGYPVELYNLIICEKLGVIEKPVSIKSVVETLDPLISDSQEKEEAEITIEKINLEKLRILIVDDNKINIQIASELLKPTGASILLATNGKDAVELTQQMKVDIVIMDMEMPIMDGLTATKEIKSLSPEIPVVMLTANLGAKYIQKSLNAGAVDCLGKPFDVHQLFLKIQEWTKK